MNTVIKTAVLGAPIAHSLSPLIHNTAFANHDLNGEMIPLHVEPQDLKNCVIRLKEEGFRGASITLPHKIDIISYCDELSNHAKDIGAVNCLVFESGRVRGHNTDAMGYVEGLKHVGQQTEGQTIHIYGAGGAAKALYFQLRKKNHVEVIARTPGKVSWTKAIPWTEHWDETWIASCSLVIDCTPIGLSKASEQNSSCQVPVHLLSDQCLVSTLIYHRHTKLLKDAAARKLAVMDGVEMLVGQAKHAFALWTGADFDHTLIAKKLRDHLATVSGG